MIEACVLDASVIARWWFTGDDVALAEEARDFLEAHLSGRLGIHAPDIALPEVGNTFWKVSRLGDWPAAAAREALAQLIELELDVHPSADLLADALGIAFDHGISVYDALYVALARRLGLPLFTADRRLVRRLGGSFPWIRAI